MTPEYIAIQCRFRRGKLRTHQQGYKLDVFRGDETLIATVYGGSPDETESRAETLVKLLSTLGNGPL
jgi:hypothetical protein